MSGSAFIGIGITGPGYLATSATSLATAATGSKNFTTQFGLAYTPGARIRATSTGTGEWMEGVVSSYTGASLVVAMDLCVGSGTHADWDINLAGQQGTTGNSGGPSYTPVTEPNATRTATLADVNALLDCTNIVGCVITIPPQSSVAWTSTSELAAMQSGAGQVQFVAGAGVTFDPDSDSYKSRKVGSIVGIKRRPTTDTWTAFGDMEYSIPAASLQGNPTTVIAPPTGLVSTADGQFAVRRSGELAFETEYLGTAGGTANAITATVTTTQSALTLQTGMRFSFSAFAASTSTAPTLALNGGTAVPITRLGGLPLAIGDIPAAGYICEVMYVAATPRWELLNPAVGTSARVLLLPKVVTSGSQSVVTFSSIPQTSTNLEIVCLNRLTGAVAIQLCSIKFNNDGTAGNYNAHRVNSDAPNASATGGDLAGTTNGGACFYSSGSTSAVHPIAVARILVPGYSQAVLEKAWLCSGGVTFNTSNGISSGQIAGGWFSTAAINRIDITTASGTFLDGSVFCLYGDV